MLAHGQFQCQHLLSYLFLDQLRQNAPMSSPYPNPPMDLEEPAVPL